MRPMTDAQRQRRDAEHARYIRSPEAREEAISHARAIDAALQEGTHRRLSDTGPTTQGPGRWHDQGDYEWLADRVARVPTRVRP